VKRFYQSAAARSADGGWAVALDGRPIRTLAKLPLVVPTQALGEAVAAEWEAQGDDILPDTMPLTGLANAAIDRVTPDREAFADGLAAYADGDALLYRAEHPADLVRRQDEVWNPILNWAEQRYGVEFELAHGVMHRPQRPETLGRLRAALLDRNDFALAAMHPLVTISGSLAIALALAEGHLDPDTAWAAGQLDELYQAEQWGEDDLAAKSRAHRRASFDAAALFLALLKG
jgi:chaperone required for assembly of F1-ATPase